MRKIRYQIDGRRLGCSFESVLGLPIYLFWSQILKIWIFYTCLAFFQKAKKADKIWLFPAFLRCLALFLKLKKPHEIWLFSWFISEQHCTKLLVEAMWPTNWLCDVTVSYLTVVFSSSVVAGLTWCNGCISWRPVPGTAQVQWCQAWCFVFRSVLSCLFTFFFS